MKKLTRQLTFVLASLLLTMLLASPAYAHDAVAGEELAGAMEMLYFTLFLLATTAFGIFVAWRKGQFTDSEEAKYRMLDLDGEEYKQVMGEY